MSNLNAWQSHYAQAHSKQQYADENVIRFINRIARDKSLHHLKALDVGSGSGRNLNFLRNYFQTAYGCDFSFNALDGQNGVLMSRAHQLPFNNNVFDFVLCWGVLHYLSQDDLTKAVSEIYRILKPGGILLATLRSTNDTHLNKTLSTGDLSGGSARLFTETDIVEIFSDFSNLKTGYISRRPIGEREIIAHHIITSEKE